MFTVSQGVRIPPGTFLQYRRSRCKFGFLGLTEIYTLPVQLSVSVYFQRLKHKLSLSDTSRTHPQLCQCGVGCSQGSATLDFVVTERTCSDSFRSCFVWS